MRARNRHVFHSGRKADPPGAHWRAWTGMLWSVISSVRASPGVRPTSGLRRGRLSADAETFSPAVLFLAQPDPQWVTFNFSPDAALRPGHHPVPDPAAVKGGTVRWRPVSLL